jgi:putative zinc finger protein
MDAEVSKLNCETALNLIHPYIDAELALSHAAEVQHHIDQCENCKLAFHDQLNLLPPLKSDSLYYRASQELEKRIRSSLWDFFGSRNSGD